MGKWGCVSENSSRVEHVGWRPGAGESLIWGHFTSLGGDSSLGILYPPSQARTNLQVSFFLPPAGR